MKKQIAYDITHIDNQKREEGRYQRLSSPKSKIHGTGSRKR